MAREAIFHRLAAREYRLARDWYAARSQRVGDRFTTAVAPAVERITNAPQSCATVVGDYRYLSVRGFPYALVFRPRSIDMMVIVAVAHGRRRPGYWRRRA